MSVSGSPAGDAPRGAIAWFVRNRVAANLLMLAILGAGLVTLGGIPQELLPETAPSAVRVQVDLPGAGAEEVEEGVLVALEHAVEDISGVRALHGLAVDGVGMLTVQTESWADFETVRGRIQRSVESLRDLPADAEDPVIADVETVRMLLRVSVHGEADERSLDRAAAYVREELRTVPGVSGVDVETGRDDEIAIEIAEERLRRFGLSFDEVAAAIRQQSADVPGGALKTDRQEVRLRVEARAAEAAHFARIPVISTPEGGLVTVGDVATVTDGFADTGRRARMNGEAAVVLRVLQAPGVQLLETVEAVEERLGETRSALPEGISVTPWASAWRLFDTRSEVLVRNGIEGLLLIFLVLFFTLSSRLAFWTAAGLPVAFFGAFLLMPVLGVTLNTLSLFAFILTLGIVVDDAIVVGENVQRHVAGRTEGRDEAAVRGVRQVLSPATFGVLTTMAAFAALLGLPGIWGELMETLPLIVIPVLAFSLVDAAWILPHHVTHGGLPVRPSRRMAGIRAGLQSLLDRSVDTLYRPVLAWALRNRLTALALALSSLLLALGALAGGWVQVEDAPPFESTLITVEVKLPPGSTYRSTAEVVDRVEEAVRTVRKEIQATHGVDPQLHLLGLTGQRLDSDPLDDSGGAAGGVGAGIGQLTLQLRDFRELRGFTVTDVANRLRALTRSLPHGGEVTVNASLLGEEANLSIRISGADIAALREASASLQGRIAEYAGVIHVTDDLDGNAPQLVGRPRTDGAGAGLRAAEVGRALRQGFHGEEVQRIRRGGGEIPVVLRYPRSDRGDPARVFDIRLPHDGALVPIDSVVDITRDSGPAVVRRVDGRRAVTVLANVDARAASVAALLADVEDRQLPVLRERFPELDFEVAGLAAETAELNDALGRNLVLALLLIYVLLAVPLASWTQPFIVLAAVPFGLFGAFVGHVVMGLDLSLSSFFGLVPLVGIVVNDALVLLAFINDRRRRGAPASEAVLASGPLRVRPIILTSLTTCAGLAPLLFDRSIEAQFLVPIAASLGFGVAYATVVTLVLVPVFYSLADEAVFLGCRAAGPWGRVAGPGSRPATLPDRTAAP